MFDGGGEVGPVLARVAELAPIRPSSYSDQQLVEVLELVEELGRHVDAMRLGLTNELDVRSVGGPDEESLAHKLGHRGTAQALELVTRSSAREAARRVRLARRLGAFPLVKAALDAGELGLEHAEAIVGPLAKVLHLAPFEAVAAAEHALVESARVQSVDLVGEQAKLWALRLDQDGVEPSFDESLRRRFFTVGKVTDELAKVSGLLPAPHAAAVQSVLDAFVNPRTRVRFTSDDEQPAPEDRRTAGQKRADALRDVFAAQARAEAVPVTVAGQAACAGGVQEVIFDQNGEALRLGRSRRGFTHRQRRAIALRDGNTCVIPGCTTPVRWCEVHHVINHKDGGPTDVGNGVHLCWFHHLEIDSGPWRVRMVGGRPELRWVYGSHASEWRPVRGEPVVAAGPPGTSRS